MNFTSKPDFRFHHRIAVRKRASASFVRDIQDTHSKRPFWIEHRIKHEHLAYILPPFQYRACSSISFFSASFISIAKVGRGAISFKKKCGISV